MYIPNAKFILRYYHSCTNSSFFSFFFCSYLFSWLSLWAIYILQLINLECETKRMNFISLIEMDMLIFYVLTMSPVAKCHFFFSLYFKERCLKIGRLFVHFFSWAFSRISRKVFFWKKTFRTWSFVLSMTNGMRSPLLANSDFFKPVFKVSTAFFGAFEKCVEKWFCPNLGDISKVWMWSSWVILGKPIMEETRI